MTPPLFFSNIAWKIKIELPSFPPWNQKWILTPADLDLSLGRPRHDPAGRRRCKLMVPPPVPSGSWSSPPPVAAAPRLLHWLMRVLVYSSLRWLLLVCSSAGGCLSCWYAPPPSAAAPRILPQLSTINNYILWYFLVPIAELVSTSLWVATPYRLINS